MILNFVSRLIFMLLWATAGLANSAMAACDANRPLKGVSLAGAEFNAGKLPGVLNKDYVYPNSAQLDYFAALGLNSIRLPFRWERIQPALFAELDVAELEQVKALVELAKRRSLCVILDVHNYGIYRGKVLGTTDVPVNALIDLWKRLAVTFVDPSATAFGLMNEPFKLPIEQWASFAQQTVTAIRRTGAKNLILVSGARWSGAHEWEKQIGGTSNADAFAHFQDPLQRTLIEVHQYADPHYAGTGQTCVPAEKLIQIFDNLTRWAKRNQQRLFLGEFGTPPNPQCLEALDRILTQMKDDRTWRGWTYWAAGSWWGGYPLSIEPRNGQDAPQTAVLRKYL